MIKRHVQLGEPIRTTGRRDDALELRDEHLGGDRCVPVAFEGGGHFQIVGNLAFRLGDGHRLFERLAGGDLMGVVDAVDGPLGANTIVEVQ